MKNNISKSLILSIFLSTVFIFGVGAVVGCDKPYTPWNSGVIWPSGDDSSGQEVSVQQEAEQAPIEDFCRDNRQDVERYKEYLKPNYDWNLSPEEERRRRRNLKRFVEEFEERCNNQNY